MMRADVTVVYDYTDKIEVVGNVYDNPDLLLEMEQKKSVALFGYPYLYQNGDLGFHEKMVELGLSRGGVILGGLPNKCILANKKEYETTIHRLVLRSRWHIDRC